MTTERNGNGPGDGDYLPPLVLPRKPSQRRENRHPANPTRSARPSAREASTATDGAAPARRADHGLSLPAVLAFLDTAFWISKLWHAQPPSLADEWHRQAESARLWRGPVRAVPDPGLDLPDPYFQDPPAPARYAEGPVTPWIRRAHWCWAPFPIVVGALAMPWAACYSPPRALALAGAVWLLLHFL